MTAAHYKGGHPPGNDLGLHYTALPPIVASCPHSDQLLVTRKFWSPGANRPSQAKAFLARAAEIGLILRRAVAVDVGEDEGNEPPPQYGVAPDLHEASERA